MEECQKALSAEEGHVTFHIDNSRDERGFTVLMLCAQNNLPKIAKICLELGADISAQSHEGLTAIHYSSVFGFEEVTNQILGRGGSLPKDPWIAVSSISQMRAEASKDWQETLKVAETAALPTESIFECPEACEQDKDRRMPRISKAEFPCFEDKLMEQNINSDQTQRVVLLDQNVYNWMLTATAGAKTNLQALIEGLKPASIRPLNVAPTKVHRRAVIGIGETFELLAASFIESPGSEKVALFSPFVTGESDGVFMVGILIFAVCVEEEVSMFKTLSECIMLIYPILLSSCFSLLSPVNAAHSQQYRVYEKQV